jgi:hypothetical protein
MISMLSQAMATRLINFTTQIKEAQGSQGDKEGSSESSGSTLFDQEAAESLLREALQPELDRLIQVPFGVPLLHEIG